MKGFAKALIHRLLAFVIEVFFREAEGLNCDKIPTSGPVIFVCAPHANQFLDPLMVMRSCGREVGFLIAAVSLKRKMVGFFAKAMNSIPVTRPQDLATKGTGVVTVDHLKIIGTDTKFTEVFKKDFSIQIAGEMAVVADVISDTELLIKEPGFSTTLKFFPFKVIPKIDQAQVYDTVYEVLSNGDCVGIFPEGGSHDRTEVQELKGGVAVMALGAMSKFRNQPDSPEKRNVNNLVIIPVGLVYFRAHAFRSTAYADYGTPIRISDELVEQYMKGGADKREACSTLLKQVHNGLKEVTVSAPDYETLQMYQAIRRLYKPTGLKLSPDQKLELNRSFSQGYEKFKDDPKVQAYEKKIQDYRKKLKQLRIKDHQVKRIADGSFSKLIFLLIWRVLLLIILFAFGLPGLVLSFPVFVVAENISKKKAAQAKANSSIKIAGRDVLATWKILIAFVLAPLIWTSYTFLVAFAVYYFGESLSTMDKILIPISISLFLPWMFYGSIIFIEQARNIFLSLSPLFVACFNPQFGKDLKQERRDLQFGIQKLVDQLGPRLFPDFNERRVIPKELVNEKAQTLPSKSKGQKIRTFSHN